MNLNNNYEVLLYYHYVNIDDPVLFAKEHLEYCKKIGVLGRILVSKEGINGTLSGTLEQTKTYMDYMHKDERFSDMPFKIDKADSHAFKKIHVRPKKELVNLGLANDINPLELTGKYLKPSEWKEAMLDENTVIIDARNYYEYDLGHFQNSIRPEIKTFRELPKWIKENKEQLKGKKLLTYCTGGVRCEKFSGWLIREGFDDVSQLEGGIATYSKDPKTLGEYWDGMMYVFDNRISVPINQVEHKVIGRDYFTNEPCERYVNCGNPECNKQIICSKETEDKFLRGCSHECRVHPRNRFIHENKLNYEEAVEYANTLR